MTTGHIRLAVGGAVASVVVAADVASKNWALDHARAWPPATLWEGVIELSVTLNHGTAFGLGASTPYSPWIVSGLAIVLLGLIARLAIRLAPTHSTASIALGLAFGGTLANLLDRAFRTVPVWGEVPRAAVVDFIVVRLGPQTTWPAFNLADVAIAVGLPWAALVLLRRRK